MKLGADIERLLRQRYYHAGEGWPILVNRVIDHVFQADTDEKIREKARDELLHRVWLPNSPCLVNSATKTGGLFACFVVGPDRDELEHHSAVLGDIAVVGKRGGGCGFTGTHMRPAGAPVAGSVHGSAYGPNKWALRVGDYLEMVTHGNFRSIALMYTMRSDHPDLEAFISLKQHKDERFGYNFNQSVMATDQWIRDGITGKHDLLDTIAENAWSNGEPGLLFYDTINNQTPYIEEINATNPCGEQPLPSYGSCNLASINVAHDRFFEGGNYNYDRLYDVATTVAQFLDNVGSQNTFPNNKFDNWYTDHRPIGVGIMGLADLFLNMEYVYGCEDSIAVLLRIVRTIYQGAKGTSEKLGLTRGIPEMCQHVGRRNITLTSIAPTGSIAFIAGCSHSIEPIFSPVYKRTDEKGEQYIFEHPLADRPFFVSALNDDPIKIPSWQTHVDIQASCQKFCDSGVSKTVNLPSDIEASEVRQVIEYAWREGCKGITVYRDGSREVQVLETQQQIEVACPTGVCEIA